MPADALARAGRQPSPGVVGLPGCVAEAWAACMGRGRARPPLGAGLRPGSDPRQESARSGPPVAYKELAVLSDV